jgi:ribose transport system substrate-binding protein
MKKSVRAAALLLPLMLVAAACGDDDDTTTPANTAAPAGTTGDTAAAGGDEAAAGLARAQAAVDAGSTEPENIGPTIALTAKPEKKTVAWLECEQPSCAAITPGFKDATAALGWDLIVIPASSGAQGPAIQQALDQGADYIAHTGSPLATAEAEMEAAKAKGVPYASCYSTDDPDFENNNLLLQCGDEEAVKVSGALIANWEIVDSQGTANILIVNIPDFPVLIAEADASKAAYAENCPGCKVQELNVTINQLIAGEVPAAVASAIQANADINYIHFTFGDLPAGVADTLEGAGLLEGRKITGVDFSTQIGLPEIIDGRHAAWTSNPKPYAAWLMVDAFARHAVGMDNPEERATAALPTFVVSDADGAKRILDLGDAGWPGPATMADQFKALWGA